MLIDFRQYKSTGKICEIKQDRPFEVVLDYLNAGMCELLHDAYYKYDKELAFAAFDDMDCASHFVETALGKEITSEYNKYRLHNGS